MTRHRHTRRPPGRGAIPGIVGQCWCGRWLILTHGRHGRRWRPVRWWQVNARRRIRAIHLVRRVYGRGW